MLVAPPDTFVAVGGLARLLVAEAGLRVPEYRTDAELAEDCRIVLQTSRDPLARDMAAHMQMALAVSRPHTPPKGSVA
jgi:hypothetical protein